MNDRPTPDATVTGSADGQAPEESHADTEVATEVVGAPEDHQGTAEPEPEVRTGTSSTGTIPAGSDLSDSERSLESIRSGFQMREGLPKPIVKALPDAMLEALRAELRAAMASHYQKTSDADAERFVSSLGQASLVVAFLSAGLNLDLAADKSTRFAAHLFSMRDPALSDVLRRMGQLEKLEQERGRSMTKLLAEVSAVREATESAELVGAYQIADDEKHFLRGHHDLHQVPLDDPDVLWLRDRARAVLAGQRRLAAERAGRPLR